MFPLSSRSSTVIEPGGAAPKTTDTFLPARRHPLICGEIDAGAGVRQRLAPAGATPPAAAGRVFSGVLLENAPEAVRDHDVEKDELAFHGAGAGQYTAEGRFEGRTRQREIAEPRLCLDEPGRLRAYRKQPRLAPARLRD